MRLVVILGILGLTALLFYTAVRSNTYTADAGTEAPNAQLLQDQLNLTQEAEAKVSNLEEQLVGLREEQQNLKAELASAESNTTKLTQLEAENSGLSDTVATLQSEIQSLGVLGSEKAELTSENVALAAELEKLRADKFGADDLMAEKDALSAELAAAQSELAASAEVAAENIALIAANDTLSKNVASLESELTTMQTAVADESTAEQALNESLLKSNAEKGALEQDVASLQAALESNEAKVASLNDELKAETAALALANDRLAAVPEETSSVDESAILEMEAELASLRSAITIRDIAITELRDQEQPASASQLSQCQERSDAALTGNGIAFQSGATGIAVTSLAQLTGIAEVAIECAQYGFVLEIEGHTDSEGGNASNLLLSNGRAKAVYDFLVDLGVPSATMRSVGYGKSDPIADSATADGRAKNERVVFDWEQS